MSTQTQETSEKPEISTKDKIIQWSFFISFTTAMIYLSVFFKNGRMFTVNDLKEIPPLWNIALPWGLSRWCDVLIGPICAAIYFPINVSPAWQWANRGLFMGLYSGVVCLFFLGYLCGIATGLFYGVCLGLAMAMVGHED